MVFSLEHDIKVTKSHQNLLPTQSVIVAHTVEEYSLLRHRGISIYYTTRGLKILDYTRRVARKHHEIEDRVVFPATRRVIENFPSSSCIRVDYIMNKINK
jgi:hypothetical protein